MLSFFYFIITCLSAFTPENTLIEWTHNRKLTWSDFKAVPEKNNAAAALTSTSIKIDCGYSNSTAEYHIRCSFDPSKSWGRVKNDYILSHEQAHFDIAEIYARKLNKDLKSYKPDENNFSKDVNKIYEKVMREYYEEQEKYDHETNFSINRARQEEWLKKVSEELSGLKKFSSYN